MADSLQIQERESVEILYAIKLNRIDDPTPGEIAGSGLSEIDSDDPLGPSGDLPLAIEQSLKLHQETKAIINEFAGDNSAIETEVRKLFGRQDLQIGLSWLLDKDKRSILFQSTALANTGINQGGGGTFGGLIKLHQSGRWEGMLAASSFMTGPLPGSRQDFWERFRQTFDRTNDLNQKDPSRILDLFDIQDILFDRNGLKVAKEQGFERALGPSLFKRFKENGEIFKDLSGLQDNWNYLKGGTLGNAWGKIKEAADQRVLLARSLGIDPTQVNKIEQIEMLRTYFGEDFSKIGSILPNFPALRAQIRNVQNLSAEKQVVAIRNIFRNRNLTRMAQAIISKRQLDNWRQINRSGLPLKQLLNIETDDVTKSIAKRFLKIMKERNFSPSILKQLNSVNPKAVRHIFAQNPMLLEKVKIGKLIPGLRNSLRAIQYMKKKLSPEDFARFLQDSVNDNPQRHALINETFTGASRIYEEAGVDVPVSDIAKVLINMPTLDEDLQDRVDQLQPIQEPLPDGDLLKINPDVPLPPGLDSGVDAARRMDAINSGNPDVLIRGTKDSAFTRFVRGVYDDVRRERAEKQGLEWDGKDEGAPVPDSLDVAGPRGAGTLTAPSSDGLTTQEMLNAIGETRGRSEANLLLNNRDKIYIADGTGVDPFSSTIDNFSPETVQEIKGEKERRQAIEAQRRLKKFQTDLGKAQAGISLAKIATSLIPGEPPREIQTTIQAAQVGVSVAGALSTLGVAGATAGPIGLAVGGAALAIGLLAGGGGGPSEEELRMERVREFRQNIRQTAAAARRAVTGGAGRAQPRETPRFNIGLRALGQRPQTPAGVPFRSRPRLASTFGTLRRSRSLRSTF